ncbi:hypothetical protein HDU67_007210 [Dinochytrium kinnereticum]|nr:hypothetical protein HDU67_007210 [Dinochytrium kinnereticum]
MQGAIHHLFDDFKRGLEAHEARLEAVGLDQQLREMTTPQPDIQRMVTERLRTADLDDERCRKNIVARMRDVVGMQVEDYITNHPPNRLQETSTILTNLTKSLTNLQSELKTQQTRLESLQTRRPSVPPARAIPSQQIVREMMERVKRWRGAAVQAANEVSDWEKVKEKIEVLEKVAGEASGEEIGEGEEGFGVHEEYPFVVVELNFLTIILFRTIANNPYTRDHPPPIQPLYSLHTLCKTNRTTPALQLTLATLVKQELDNVSSQSQLDNLQATVDAFSVRFVEEIIEEVVRERAEVE